MKLPWYRMYTEARTDFKLQTLTDEEHRVWFSLLCYAAERGKSGTIFLEAPENTKQENIQSPKNVGDRQKTPVIAIKMYTLAVECARANVDLLQRVLTKLMALDIVFFDATEVTFLHFQERQYDKPSNRPDAVKERRERQQAKKELLDSTPKNAGDRQKTHR